MAAKFESTTIFRRVIEPDVGDLPPELARYLMTLDFKPEDHSKYELLSAKAQEGALTADEAAELDGLLHVDSLITILRLKGERSLARKGA